MVTGQRLGAYEILAKLGEGGMGEVYRARDLRLDRHVAIKVLPASFADDADRVMRFEREAKTLASLNHPHVAQIYGIEQSAATSALVMELVEGETLADRIARGPLLLDEAVALARQIAEALEAAHERGIVHRDLKPANVMITANGVAKVLDFGLAKDHTSTSAPSMSSTVLGATGVGVILGTAPYMSPEQARGNVVDKRSDVWAFGCVLYEMLTGAQAVRGATVTDVLAAVVHDEPKWSDIPAQTPPHVIELLKRCLHKDARQRLRDIGEARIALERGASVPPVAGAAEGRTPTRTQRLWGLVAALVIAVIALGGYAWRLATRAPSLAASVTHLSMTFPLGLHLGQPQPSLALSPDGRRLVYTGGRADLEATLWMRALDQPEPTVLANTGNRNAFFSPDGQWVGVTGPGIWRMPAASGPLVRVCDNPGGAIYGATWTNRDQIVFAVPATGLWRVAASGGTPERIAAGRFWYPDALPDGRRVLVTADNPAARTSDDLRIAIVDIDTGAVRVLFDGGTYVRYAASGHLVYLRNGTLMAVPFDATDGEVRGNPVAMINNVFMNPGLPGGNFALSPTGTLAYAAGTAKDFQNALLTVGGDGSRPLTDVRRTFGIPRLSPDGTRVAVTVSLLQNAAWLLEIERGILSRLTPDEYDVGSLAWLPDGRSLVVAASTANEPRNLYLVRAEAGAPMERLTKSAFPQMVGTFTPDGKQLVFMEARPAEDPALWIVSLEGDRSSRRLVDRALSAAMSRDGKWLAFESARGGTVTTYVADFPALKQIAQVATEGARFPVWSAKGRLYYRHLSDSSIMAVDVGGDGATRISRPQYIASVPESANATAAFDVMPDGRILVTDSKGIGWTSELKIVLNWFTELRQKAPASH